MKTNLETPLLRDGNAPDGANDRATLGELGACCPSGGVLRVEDLETSTPDEAFKILSEQGVKTLGSIVVPVSAEKFRLPCNCCTTLVQSTFMLQS